jgi:DNA-directed RNA polymerase subunit RPC12/RpoP
MAGEDERQRDGPIGSSILVECLSCGRKTALPREAGAEDLPLVHLTRRLKCSECGSRAVKAARVETPRDVARLIRARMGSGRS